MAAMLALRVPVMALILLASNGLLGSVPSRADMARSSKLTKYPSEVSGSYQAGERSATSVSDDAKRRRLRQEVDR